MTARLSTLLGGYALAMACWSTYLTVVMTR